MVAKIKEVTYKRRVELKPGQFTIVKQALEIYISELSSEYQSNPTLEGARRQDEVMEVLEKFKNAKLHSYPKETENV